MKDIVGDWLDRDVSVTLLTSVPVALHGRLLDVDDSGVLLQLPQGKTFIPITSILHVTAPDGT